MDVHAVEHGTGDSFLVFGHHGGRAGAGLDRVAEVTARAKIHTIGYISCVLLTVALTQVINGAAAVTVIAPIAIATAQQVGMEPRSVAMAVALASSMAFMSPLGHAVNVMVMGAGGYTFKDYARVGIPLTILLVIVLMIALPLIMPIN